MRRVEAAGFKAVPTGIEHGTVTVVVDGTPFEVTTLREDVETFGRQRQGRVRPRLAARRRAARLHHERAVGHAATARCTTMSAGSPTSPRGACASSATPQRASPRTICASCASSASTPPTAMAGSRTPAGLHACIAARAGLDTLSRERVRMEMLKLMLARHAVPTLAVMAEAGLLETVLGGVPLLASLRNMIKLEAALALAARSGAPARRARRAA